MNINFLNWQSFSLWIWIADGHMQISSIGIVFCVNTRTYRGITWGPLVKRFWATSSRSVQRTSNICCNYGGPFLLSIVHYSAPLFCLDAIGSHTHNYVTTCLTLVMRHFVSDYQEHFYWKVLIETGLDFVSCLLYFCNKLRVLLLSTGMIKWLVFLLFLCKIHAIQHHHTHCRYEHCIWNVCMFVCINTKWLDLCVGSRYTTLMLNSESSFLRQNHKL